MSWKQWRYSGRAKQVMETSQWVADMGTQTETEMMSLASEKVCWGEETGVTLGWRPDKEGDCNPPLLPPVVSHYSIKTPAATGALTVVSVVTSAPLNSLPTLDAVFIEFWLLFSARPVWAPAWNGELLLTQSHRRNCGLWENVSACGAVLQEGK